MERKKSRVRKPPLPVQLKESFCVGVTYGMSLTLENDLTDEVSGRYRDFNWYLCSIRMLKSDVEVACLKLHVELACLKSRSKLTPVEFFS